MEYYNEKVDDIRNRIPQSSVNDSGDVITPPTFTGQALSDFELTSLPDLTKMVMAARCTTCSLDPLPALVVKELWSTLGFYVLTIMNVSFSTGIFPACFKSAVVKPLLKKPNLDPNSVANYRPVSNLSFLSKILEKIVSAQLTKYLSLNGLFEPLQSAFRVNHATETALTKVANDLLLAADSNLITVLILLDLSSAFDTVDHGTLLDRLKTHFGFSGQVLKWLGSYLTGRSYCVVYNNEFSESFPVRHGVPQGSVLGPLLFSLYLTPLGQIICSFGLSLHFYADNLQIFLPVTTANGADLNKLNMCLAAVRDWLSANFLLLNSAKTEMIFIGPASSNHQFDQLSLSLDDYVIHGNDRVKNLGVLFDRSLLFDFHVKEVARVAFFHLRRIAKIRSILSFKDVEVLIHATPYS